ncbi:MAG: outer membrane beta-barrel domain-containing protein [Bdellovibrionales bacterium]
MKKPMWRRGLGLAFVLLSGSMPLTLWAGDLTQEMDALGANRDLMKKARAIDPKNRVRVVQNREVDRHLRFEFGVSYGMNAGGDPYVSTDSLGGQVDFHITPRWSVGGRYYNHSNSLNSEGKKVFDEAAREHAAGNNKYRVPDTDSAHDSWLGVLNWYPIYGKTNLFDITIAQFDIYLLGGAGQINLASGSAPLYTAGGGVGMWITQHVSTRLEARWQGYQDEVYDGSRDINQTVLTATLGFLL